MTNLEGDILLSIATQYSLRTWIESGFRQVKQELGWHDYRLTDYDSIERWWELVFSAYLLVSLHAEHFKQHQQHSKTAEEVLPPVLPFSRHPDWETGVTWKSALSSLRLLLQPYWCWAWLEAWLQVFPTPGLKRGIHQLMSRMDAFRILPTPEQKAA